MNKLAWTVALISVVAACGRQAPAPAAGTATSAAPTAAAKTAKKTADKTPNGGDGEVEKAKPSKPIAGAKAAPPAAGDKGSASAKTAPAAADPDLVKQQLVEFMRLTRKVDLVPMSVRRDGEVLSVAVATRGSKPAVDQLITTKDGLVLLENALDLDREIEILGNDRRFAGCLLDAGVRLFIDGRKGVDRKQAAVIGRFSNTLVVNCAGAGKAECAKQKITKTPTWMLGTVKVEGGRARAWLEAATTCK